MYGLGLKTDLMLLAPFAEIIKNDGAIRVMSPAFPSYYFGNFLIVDHPPDDPHDAIDRFNSAFAGCKDIRHVTLCWDGRDVDDVIRKRYAQAQFDHSVDTVLTTKMPRTATPAPVGITCRAIHTDSDWDQVINVEYETYKDDYPNYLEFVKDSVENHKVRIKTGMGHWYGVFEGDVLVGTMGLFCVEGVARYQSVVTRPEHRGQGIASTLLCHAAADLAKTHAIDQYVIVAENDSNAQRLYIKCGFLPKQHTYSLCRYPTH